MKNLKTLIHLLLFFTVSCQDNYTNEIRSKVSEIGVVPAYHLFLNKARSRRGIDMFKFSIFISNYGDSVESLPYSSVNDEMSILNCAASAAFPDAISIATGTLESFHSSDAMRARECLKADSTRNAGSNVWIACRAEKILPACPFEFKEEK